MSQVFFASHSLEILAEELFLQLQTERTALFTRCLIVTAHPAVKEWLQFELCKRSEGKAILGLEFSSWNQVVQKILRPRAVPTRFELAAAIWTALPKEPSLHFVEELTAAFEEYCFYGFPKNVPEEALWQKKLFEEIFQSRGWSTYPESVDRAVVPKIGALHLFGIDYLPPAINQLFLKVADLSVYRFSPCAMFWEDLCSVSERKKILRRWEQKQVSSKSLQSLDGMLRDAQPLLANWGMIGRAMLKESGDAEIDLRENYEYKGNGASGLERIKLDLLMQQRGDWQLSGSDKSIQCFRTGSSLFREMQWLRDEVLKLAATGISFSEIRVYAPDISVYAPLAEFYFADAKVPIPFQIEKIDLSRQSGFYQGIIQLFRCVKGRWEAGEVAALFEMPVFYRKAKWRREEVERFREWIEMGKIRWGLDANHRKEVSAIDKPSMSEAGSWGHGWDALIDSWIFLQPEKEASLSWSETGLFEGVYGVFQQLQKKLLSWREPRTLDAWASEIKELVESTLFLDGESEADSLANLAFHRFLDDLRKTAKTFPTETFPFAWVETLFRSISKEEGGSVLNAVRFSQLETGSILPARFVFLIGMDEESFPRSSSNSSLYLPSKDSHRKGDFDRYLFLQAIFAAGERLVFSYGHISKEDGKSVSPSLLIQELFGYLGPDVFIADGPDFYCSSEAEKKSLLSNSKKLPECAKAPPFLSIQELTRFFKHPLQVYLKRILGIELREEAESPWKDFEFSPLTRHKELLAFLEHGELLETQLPLGLFGEAAKRDLAERAFQFEQSLRSWGVDFASIRDLQFAQTGTSIEIVLNGADSIHLIGEGALSAPEGVLHLGSDDIGSILRKWPEMLSVLVATGTSKIHCLKTGKIRQVADPLNALRSAVELYLCCQEDPFFLHPEWADAVLRKKIDPPLDRTKDRVLEWALERSPFYDVRVERQLWKERLESMFASLSALFPTRGQSGEI